MILCIDIDGVIVNFVEGFIEIVNEIYGIKLTEDDIIYHDLNLVLGISKEDAKKLIIKTLELDLSLMPRARESIEILYRDHIINIITARPTELNEIKIFLESKDIQYHNLYKMKEGEKYKINTKTDVIVEDNLEEALMWSKRVKKVLLFDHPWNKSINIDKKIERVKNWNEIVENIQKFLAQNE